MSDLDDDKKGNDPAAEAADKDVVAGAELPEIDTADKPGAGGAKKDFNLNILLDIPVNISVELGRTRLSIKEILRLGSGSIIEMDRLAGKPADIVVNGKRIGEGDIVVVNENFGVRITKLVDPEERIESL